MACGLFSNQMNSDLLHKTAPRSPEHKGSMRLVATGRSCLPGTPPARLPIRVRADAHSGWSGFSLADRGERQHRMKRPGMGKASKSRCAMSPRPSVFSSEEEVTIKYVCGIDVGSQSCSGCVTRADKRMVVKPSDFANTKEGWRVWEEKLAQLDAAPNQIVIGMEATSRYHENLSQELEQRGYQMRLLHPGQTHQFHQQRGLRAKTDRLDAMTITRVLPSRGSACGLYTW
jgi:hypothetical protein